MMSQINVIIILTTNLNKSAATHSRVERCVKVFTEFIMAWRSNLGYRGRGGEGQYADAGESQDSGVGYQLSWTLSDLCFEPFSLSFTQFKLSYWNPLQLADANKHWFVY